MTKTVRVNIRSVANTAAVRKEKRNGRDVVIVPSATLPDGIVMNSILYDAAEIEKGFTGLERSPAPLGHPTINGEFVSARDPEGINLAWVGAWNENARREKGKDGKHRVHVDKVIDVERASSTEGGKRLLDAIEKGEPIHTSVGLYANMEAANGDVEHKFIARDIDIDHDAFLLDEEGAGTPEQGVGVFVNSKGEQEKIEVINSAIDDADRDLDWAVDSLARALERRERAPMLERLKAAIVDLFGSERGTSQNTQENDMTVSKEQFDALSAEVKTLSESVSAEALGKTIGEVVANAVKPLVDAQTELAANQKAKDDAELADLQAKIVKANLLTEDEAKELTLNAARGLAKKAEPGKAATLNGALGDNEKQDSFKLPAGDKE